jgi:hypothetical protein
MGNIGSILGYLPVASPGNFTGGRIASRQVQIISICNTAIRFIVGALIDYFSPSPFGPLPRRRTVSRLAFLWLACVLLVIVYAYVSIFTQDQSQVWVLSVGAGIAYGTIWTVM